MEEDPGAIRTESTPASFANESTFTPLATGERVCAVVVVRPGCSFGVADARRYFADAGVARQKTPELVLVVAELPRTPAGKVQKSALRTLADAPRS